MAAHANMVQRTFYIDPRVDVELESLAYDKGVSKNEYMRELFILGMKPFLEGKDLRTKFGEPEKERDATKGKVMRSIYLTREIEDFLRNSAFELRTTKSHLMRQFLEDGLEVTRAPVAEPAMNMTMTLAKSVEYQMTDSLPEPVYVQVTTPVERFFGLDDNLRKLVSVGMIPKSHG